MELQIVHLYVSKSHKENVKQSKAMHDNSITLMMHAPACEGYHALNVFIDKAHK